MNADEALAFWQTTHFARWQKRTNKITTRRQAKANRRFVRLELKKLQKSMLNMGQPKFHKMPIADARTKTLLAAHARRREAGWIRG